MKFDDPLGYSIALYLVIFWAESIEDVREGVVKENCLGFLSWIW